MRQTMEIYLENIGKRFGGRILFENINVRFRAGQCLAVTGRNGSGKSTLLKIVAGLLRPSAGQVRFLDTQGAVLSKEQQLACIGMVAPDMAMYTALTGIENILFWTKVRGVSCTPAEAEVFCQEAGLGRAGLAPVQTYSTGMRQRLKLAVGKSLEPCVWLLDEPSSNLDTDGKAYVQELMAEALRNQAVILLATNEPEEARYATDKIEL